MQDTAKLADLNASVIALDVVLKSLCATLTPARSETMRALLDAYCHKRISEEAIQGGVSRETRTTTNVLVEYQKLLKP
jgi:hypothetical protein